MIGAPEHHGYRILSKDGILVAGAMQDPAALRHGELSTVCLASDDPAKVSELAASNGGQVLLPPVTVGDQGTMAVLIGSGCPTADP